MNEDSIVLKNMEELKMGKGIFEVDIKEDQFDAIEKYMLKNLLWKKEDYVTVEHIINETLKKETKVSSGEVDSLQIVQQDGTMKRVLQCKECVHDFIEDYCELDNQRTNEHFDYFYRWFKAKSFKQDTQKQESVDIGENNTDAESKSVNIDVEQEHVESIEKKGIEKPRALIVLIHGLGYCSSLIGHFANSLKNQLGDVDVVGFDHLGHGRSSSHSYPPAPKDSTQDVKHSFRSKYKPDCAVKDYKLVFENTLEFLYHLVQPKGNIFKGDSKNEKERFVNVPIFLIGESMGGSAALQVYYEVFHSNENSKNLIDKETNSYRYEFLREQIKGLGLSAPAIKATQAPNFLLRGIVNTLSSWLPNVKVTSGDFTLGSRVPSMLKIRYTYPECWLKGLPFIMAKTILHLTDYTDERVSKFGGVTKVPFLVMHGTEDKVVGIDGTHVLYDNSENEHKMKIIFKNAYHALLSDYTSPFLGYITSKWIQHYINNDNKQPKTNIETNIETSVETKIINNK